ncbi:MAG: phosphoribosylglycinamide formyltransferase [Candidatus Marinimicrobia bacterium]|nr:phosphoribosylglycinamide formyltransferase [Candidatus Neomarinimicrobiota bacterium]|tara:strand:+ start:7742 stop:8317 length:576 start_codon:yes stop_codon:yes gene_type:complete
MMKLGVIGSTKGTDLKAICDSISSGKLDAEVAVVLSNRAKAYILERAKKNKIPAFYISHVNKTRNEFDREMTTILKKYQVELVLLIGFMRILSNEFCLKWKDKILNVHPSLLPKYSGGMDLNVHEAVLANGDVETGCTIHFVTEDVDAGPIIVQKRCHIEPSDTAELLKKKVQALEGIAYIEAINLLTSNR